MRVLITGGAGTLGSNIAERFQNNGIEFLIIDNFETGSKKNIKKINKKSFIELDIIDFES